MGGQRAGASVFAVAAFVAAVVAVVCVGGVHGDVTTLWPQPKVVSSGTEAGVTLSSGTFKFVATCAESTTLSGAFERATKEMFVFGAGDGTGATASEAASDAFVALNALDVCVVSSDETLDLGTDESYVLDVRAGERATLHADTVYGAMYGLTTFVQLVEYGYSNDTYSIAATPIVIDDAPRFAWRGLLVDTARHYIPASFLPHVIDGMAANKMNVLHWHLVDAISFAAEIEGYPELAQAGAWHPSAVFTFAEMQSVVAYGRARGVRVVPEFDGPGHAAAWGFSESLGGIVADCPAYEANINNIPLNPMNATTFKVLKAVYETAAKAFPDAFLHSGGDEVVQQCWTDDRAIAEWMAKQGLSTKDVYQLFENKMHEIASLSSVNKTLIVWNEVFQNGLSIAPSTVVEVWTSQTTLKAVLAAGHRGILAAPFYLDKQIPALDQGGDPDYVTFYEWVDTWESFYTVDMTANLTAAEASLLLGGEATMWAEQVDVNNFDSRVWSRAPSVAERLWSAGSVNNVDAAMPRLNAQLCRMQQQGIRCGPVAPSWCLFPSSGQWWL